MSKGIDEETVRERQSRVVRAGGDWEQYVKLYLTEQLQGSNIAILEGGEIPRNSALWKQISVPLRGSTLEEAVWGDIDLVAVKSNIPIAILSCKLSLHGRFTETLFYSLLFRTLSKMKVILVTPDAGRGQSGKWASEWGTPEQPTKDRLLAESYLNGVYVENVETFCKDIKPGERTAIGGIVRPLSELPGDLTRWGEEATRFTYIKRGLDSFH